MKQENFSHAYIYVCYYYFLNFFFFEGDKVNVDMCPHMKSE